MSFYSQDLYKSLESALDTNRQMKSNLLIVTLPGLGISYFLKSYLKKKNDKSISYLHNADQKLNKYNILDLDFDNNPDALTIAENYFRSADIDQKFALVINNPKLISTENFKSTYLAKHLYQTFYFTTRNLKDTEIFALEINHRLTTTRIKEIFASTGGIGKLIKFLAINPLATDFPEDLVKDIIHSISQTDPEILKKMNIDTSLPFLTNSPQKLNIKINFDLSFLENDILSEEKLTKEEKDILDFLLENKNEISREKVSDFKWGEGKYDEFSDQAINKSMRRLSDKLKYYEIETIPKVGYKIIPK